MNKLQFKSFSGLELFIDGTLSHKVFLTIFHRYSITSKGTQICPDTIELKLDADKHS